MSSNAPRSKAPESKAPKSQVPGTRPMPSNADRAESRTPKSQVPGTRPMPSNADRAESRAPGTRPMPSNADRAESRTPKSYVPKTMINTPSKATRGPATKPTYDDDDEYDDEPAASTQLKQPKSFLFTPKDFELAERQSRYASLAPAEKKENDKWAFEMFKKSDGCPEGNRWIRAESRPGWFGHGGYYCNKKGHAATDNLISEGLGGMYLIKDEDLDDLAGPYYTHPEKPGKTCHAEDMINKGYEVIRDNWFFLPEGWTPKWVLEKEKKERERRGR